MAQFLHTASELSPALNKIKNVLSDSINSMLTFGNVMWKKKIKMFISKHTGVFT